MVDSGEECIDRFIEEKSRGNKIHLMLLDYKMGGILGDSVARKIKEYPGTKIILNSAYNVDDVLKEWYYLRTHDRPPPSLVEVT